jgi:DNA-binding NarL/FixJ family response regulator
VSQYVIDGYRRRAPGARASREDSSPDSIAKRDMSPERMQLARLTPRQREVLQLIAEGVSSRAMARTLNLSVKTIESHRAQLMERLDIHELAGLVRFAIRAGLVRNDSA